MTDFEELDDLYTQEEQDDAVRRAAMRELRRREDVAKQRREMDRLLRGGLVMFGAILGLPIKKIDYENITLAHEFYVDEKGRIAWARETNCKFDACSPVDYSVYAPLTEPPVEAPQRGKPVVDRALRELYGDSATRTMSKGQKQPKLTQKQKDKLAKKALAEVRRRASRVALPEPTEQEQAGIEEAAE